MLSSGTISWMIFKLCKFTNLGEVGSSALLFVVILDLFVKLELQVVTIFISVMGHGGVVTSSVVDQDSLL